MIFKPYPYQQYCIDNIIFNRAVGLFLECGLGNLNQHLKALASPADAYVINRKNVQWLVEFFKNSWAFDMVILDESFGFKKQSEQAV